MYLVVAREAHLPENGGHSHKHSHGTKKDKVKDVVKEKPTAKKSPKIKVKPEVPKQAVIAENRKSFANYFSTKSEK